MSCKGTHSFLNSYDDPRSPGLFGDDQVASLVKGIDQLQHFFSMTFGPVGLRQHIVDDVQGAWFEHGQHFIEVKIISGPGIGKNVIEAFVGMSLDPFIAIAMNKL